MARVVARARFLALPLAFLSLGTVVPCVGGGCALDVDTATYIGGGPAGPSPALVDGGVTAAPVDAADLEGADAGAGSGGDAGDGDSPPVLDAYAKAVLADAPALYFRLDDTASPLKDASGHGTRATATNVVWAVPGAIAGNGAVHLDGASSVIDVGSAADFTGTAPFTLEAWASIELDDGTYRHLFTKDFTGGAGREEFGLYVHTGQLVFERYVDDVPTAAGVNLSTLGAPPFIHAVAVYNGSALILYAQGNEVDRTADTRGQPSKPTSLFVGTKGTGFGTMKATLDEVAVYDHALTAARVAAHFAAASAK